MSYINITGADLKAVAKAAYEFSRPQGLGFLHFQNGALSDSDAKALVDAGYTEVPLRMDYVHGRACKMVVYRRDEQLFIRGSWYDHTENDLQDFLAAIGKSDAPLVEELPELKAA